MRDLLNSKSADGLPRAPSQTVWDAMTTTQQAMVVNSLPAWMPEAELSPPEGDAHRLPIQTTSATLEDWYRARKRGIYVGVDLAVYYPDQTRFAPDVFVALDVTPGPRDKWVVAAENKGLDWVLEVLYRGDRRKDLVANVNRYAQLGIPEYFVYDRRRLELHGWRLPEPDATLYEPIKPDEDGRLFSQVLTLNLGLEGTRLRFYVDGAVVLQPNEILDQLSKASSELTVHIIQIESQLKAAEDREAAMGAALAAEVEAHAAEVEARTAAEAEVTALKAQLALLTS